MRKAACLLLFVLISTCAWAQEGKPIGKITGKIIDSISTNPIEYATISLLQQVDGKVVNGCTTDSKGNFVLDNVSIGTYKMLIYFIGFKTATYDNILISKSNPIVTIPDIHLQTTSTKLKEVTIEADKSLIEYKIDKMVYNSENDLTSQTGTASDILKKIPQVAVDIDGNVELQGNSSIRFLINGKPSIIFGSNIADVLQSIPAGQIQSIEVITSPGAKYDAEGTGGIINIILKKSTAEGFNGNVSLTGGTRLESGSINLNMHHNHVGINAFVNGSGQLLSTTYNSMDRLSNDSLLNPSQHLIQNGESEFYRGGFESGLEMNWDMTEKDNVSASFGYDYFATNNNGLNNQQDVLLDPSGSTLSSFSQQLTSKSQFHEQSYDIDLSYTHSFDEDQELELVYACSNGGNYNEYSQIQKMASTDSILDGSSGKNPTIENESSVELNYTQPLGEDASLEAGGKFETCYTHIFSDVFLLNTLNDNYDYSANESSTYKFKSYVYACYLSAEISLFDWLNVMVGCRDEYTEPHATFSNSGIANIKSYNTLVPSAAISHEFSGHQLLKLNYSYRIERPDDEDLNPFINASDPQNITTGNILLRPEISNKIELGYNKTFDKGLSLNFVLFCRANTDDIQSYTTYYPTYVIGDSTYYNVAVTTRENVGAENNFGLNIFGSIPLGTKINLRTNIACFERYIINGALAGSNIHGFNYRINLNASYEITPTFSLELFGNFRSPRTNTQGTKPASTTYNFALRKQFFDKKLSLALTATNPFSKNIIEKTELTGTNFTLVNSREVPYRSFGINLTFKFGKMEFKEEKEIEDPDLMNKSVGGN